MSAFNITTTRPIFTNSGGDSHEDDDDDDDDDDDMNPYDFLNVGVPIAIMGIIVFSLCMIVIYTKIRRRNQRAQGIPRDTAPNVSGGVAMNVNVYRNYGVYVNNINQQGTGPGPELMEPPMYEERPPSYDDAIKDTNTTQTGFVNSSFASTSQDDVSSREPPPSYESNNDARDASSNRTSEGVSTVLGATPHQAAGESPAIVGTSTATTSTPPN